MGVNQATSEVLRGVVVYFEGYTDDMTAFQLKKLVYSNGGEIRHAPFVTLLLKDII